MWWGGISVPRGGVGVVGSLALHRLYFFRFVFFVRRFFVFDAAIGLAWLLLDLAFFRLFLMFCGFAQVSDLASFDALLVLRSRVACVRFRDVL